MEDKKIIIGVGVVALLGVGYYMMKKNKQTPLVNMPNKPALPTFDRDKASREFAKFAFPIVNKREEERFGQMPSPATIGNAKQYSNASGVAGFLSREQVLANTLNDYRVTIADNRPRATELSLYKSMFAYLNAITDDSDAEFALNVYKKIAELGEGNYKPDLDTQIRRESIQKKYPNARLS